jgi:hypothetical protein
MQKTLEPKNINSDNLEDPGCFGPSFLPCGKAGGLQIRRCQGLAVAYYGGTLGALSLEPSGFCNTGVYSVALKKMANECKTILNIEILPIVNLRR